MKRQIISIWLFSTGTLMQEDKQNLKQHLCEKAWWPKNSLCLLCDAALQLVMHQTRHPVYNPHVV